MAELIPMTLPELSVGKRRGNKVEFNSDAPLMCAAVGCLLAVINYKQDMHLGVCDLPFQEKRREKQSPHLRHPVGV